MDETKSCLVHLRIQTAPRRPRIRALQLLILVVSVLYVQSTAFAQVFGIRRPNIWYLQVSPSLNLFLGHTGIDGSSGTTVSDVLRWGAEATIDAGANARKLTFAAHLRLEYQESHSSEEPVVKGPSVFDLAVRALYSPRRDSTTVFGLAVQGGCYTVFLPETQAYGLSTKTFFNPASLYEALLISREDQFGQQNQLKTSFQLGYSLQQSVSTESEAEGITGSSQSTGTNAQNVGLTAVVAVEFLRQAWTADQHEAGSFFAGISAKGFKKEVGFKNWKNSRIEGAGRIGFSVFQFLEFVTAVELVYDSDISPRRELRTTVTIGLKYDMAFSGKL